MKQDDNETLDKYWKRLVDIERKRDFNNVTAEEIITYKFAATIKDKKARDKFIKCPLKNQSVLETIELDNYNRQYEDKKPRNKKPQKRFNKKLIGRRTDRRHKPSTKTKTVFKPELPLLRKTELVTRTHTPGT